MRFIMTGTDEVDAASDEEEEIVDITGFEFTSVESYQNTKQMFGDCRVEKGGIMSTTV